MKQLLTGNDGKARGAVVSVVGSKKGLTDLRRSIQHLIPVECNEVAERQPETVPEKNTDVVESRIERKTDAKPAAEARTVRPRRQAAILSYIKRQCY